MITKDQTLLEQVYVENILKDEDVNLTGELEQSPLQKTLEKAVNEIDNFIEQKIQETSESLSSMISDDYSQEDLMDDVSRAVKTKLASAIRDYI
jgi:hypothetical protein